MALTEQKRRYAEARLSGKSKKEAAIAAGCPEKTASQAASRYEKDPDVQAALGRATAVKASKKDEPPTGDPDAYIPAAAAGPIEFFEQVMNDLEADPKLRMEAAKNLAAFTVAKPSALGKKEQKQKDAEQVAGNRFGLRGQPKLVVSNP
ncbi:hypothetical protein [Pseudomonas plecoglossicida]|uniref:hypothetical protein n=1 Tax=Pseudomonas plecoglossicida TaxID=70775 RepID=UPI00051DA536|nr:hypothetical protein [Pseudomonas plecoglossicida]KGK24350.1 hypothetical protein GT93_05610 [Pseudomonas plecoglossicida]